MAGRGGRSRVAKLKQGCRWPGWRGREEYRRQGQQSIMGRLLGTQLGTFRGREGEGKGQGPLEES